MDRLGGEIWMGDAIIGRMEEVDRVAVGKATSDSKLTITLGFTPASAVTANNVYDQHRPRGSGHSMESAVHERPRPAGPSKPARPALTINSDCLRCAGG